MRRVLYLEDDEFTRLMVQAQLEKAGYEVDSFSGYADVVKALEEKTYELIITDLNIEGHSPADLIGDIKNRADIPIVVLSGTKITGMPGTLTIAKPLTAEKIRQIDELMENQPADINLSKVYQFACGDEELFTTYINIFIENLATDLAELKKEIENNVTRRVRDRAHKMLSSATYYNYQPLNRLLQHLELNAESLSHESLCQYYEQVEVHAKKLMTLVQHNRGVRIENPQQKP